MPIRLTCPSESTMAGFLERRLSMEQRANLEAHVDGCASCRRLVIELSSGLQLLSVVAEAHTTHPASAAGDGKVLVQGTVVDRFVVLDLLGRGGMGVVYMAYDPELDRKVALKLLHPGARPSSETRAQLLAEAQVMARINHTNVIAIYDVGTYREQVFAAMELVEGTTLRRWMAERPRTWREVVDVFLLAGEGLAAAHAAGVVHRDFKPENVLLGGDGRVKVSDFGLAADPSPTRSHIAGTPGYLAVEGFRPGGVDERGDQFSFCVSFHEALHGRRPFSAQEVDQLVAEVCRGPMLEGRRRAPARLNHIVRRGLALGPADRYPSMRELLADIRRALAVQRMLRLVAAAVSALVLAIGATVVVVDAGAVVNQAPCADITAQLSGVWDRARREAAQVAFRRMATPAAVISFERVVTVVDRYATEWVAIRTQACTATEVRGEQSAAVLELRTACLDRARGQLQDVGDRLISADGNADADADAVREVITAAATLPALDACSDVEALRTGASARGGFAARAKIQPSTAANKPPNQLADFARSYPDKLAARPDFRLPFSCGEAWQITEPRPRHSAAQADFYLPDDGSSAGLAVFASAPGWVSRVSPDNGQVDINHGGGWFTTYQHMTDIGVSLHQYIGRGHVIGRVGNVNVKKSRGQPGPAHLHYEQAYQAGVENVDFDHDSGRHRGPRPGPVNISLYLDRETFVLSVTGSQLRTSTNNCVGGGAPGGAAPYDVPISTTVFSPSRVTMEIMTRRSDDHALLERWFDGQWNSAAMPHMIVGQPAVTVFNGELHILARKSSGAIFDLHYNPFTGWGTTYLPGIVSGDPDVVEYGWNKNLHVAARGIDGFLYHWWTAPNGSWVDPVRMGNGPVVGTPALFSHYDRLYIVARAADGAVWSWKADRRGVWTESQLPGAASDGLDIGVDPETGRVNVVARGTDNRIYRWQAPHPHRAADHAGEGWSHPEIVDPDHVVAGAPATIIYHGTMHIFARGADGASYHWWRDRTWHQESIGRTYTGGLDTIVFTDQLQTIGRGADGSLHTVWYDPSMGFWKVENQYVSVTD